MIAAKDDVVDRVMIGMGTSSTFLSPDGYEAAVDEAVLELALSFPVNNAVQEMWLVKRAKRHSLFILYIEAANRFQYKQLKLNQRFDHYQKIIAQMDVEFQKAMSENWLELMGVSPSKLFIKIDAGFQYDGYGEDTTYQFGKYVNFSSIEESST
jgi:hypothetical protein